MKCVPALNTERLFLRGITEEDTKFIVQLRSNPDIYKYFVFAHIIAEQEHLNWFRSNYLENEDRFDWIALDIQNHLVGVFGIKRESKSTKEAEISYILSPKYYGMGYAAESIERLIQFCREEWNCYSVKAEIHEENIDSIRFAERLGFLQDEKKGSFLSFKKQL